MPTILLTGIPGSGKSELSKQASELMHNLGLGNVYTFSLSDEMGRIASEKWNTSPSDLHNVEYLLQQELRDNALYRLGDRLRERDSTEFALIETCMTLPVQDREVFTNVINPEQMLRLDSDRTLRYFVTVIDNPADIREQRAAVNHQISVDEILNWMNFEAEAARTHFRYLDLLNDKYRNKPGMPIRHIIIPRQNSERTLAALLTEKDLPVVCYLAGPITALKVRPDDDSRTIDLKTQAKESIAAFREMLKDYCIVLAPIELADLSTTSSKEMANTVYRDMNWFSTQADFTLPYYPPQTTELQIQSFGTYSEKRRNLDVGKPLPMVHPCNRYDVFGVKPTLHFRTGEEFFDAVMNSRSPKYINNPDYQILRRLLCDDKDEPRYRYLRQGKTQNA